MKNNGIAREVAHGSTWSSSWRSGRRRWVSAVAGAARRLAWARAPRTVWSAGRGRAARRAGSRDRSRAASRRTHGSCEHLRGRDWFSYANERRGAKEVQIREKYQHSCWASCSGGQSQLHTCYTRDSASMLSRCICEILLENQNNLSKLH